jgi:hypothetical protein
MHRSRKSIATVAAALAGVLAMAGVAAAAHGSSKAKTDTGTSGHHQRRHHGNPTTTAVAAGTVATTTEAQHATPEPGDDSGVDPVGAAAANAKASTAPGSASTPEAADDNGQDPAGHDANEANEANDDNGEDATTTTVEGATPTSMPDETTTTAAPIPDGLQTFTVTGGTVTVDVEGGVLSLVSATPNPGFVVDKSEARPDRVEVEFNGNDTQSRVRVRIDGGRLRVETGDH